MSGLLDVAAGVDTRVALAVYVAALDAWAVMFIVRSDAAARDKWIWSAIVLLCPILGTVFWGVLGPKPEVEPLDEEELRA